VLKVATGFPEDDAEKLAKLTRAPLDICAAALVEAKGNYNKAKKAFRKERIQRNG
jgi:translation elongation factor EF-Ts